MKGTLLDIINSCDHSLGRKVLKVAELYPQGIESYLIVKRRFPGCIYYMIIEGEDCLNLNDRLLPHFRIAKNKVHALFPFRLDELDFYIYHGHVYSFREVQKLRFT